MSLLSTAAKQKIDRELTKYPADQKQSACMAALAIAQDEHGWLSNELMDEVAQYLGMAPVAVYEVATFYNMYNLKPTGKHKVTVCTNLPCALSGGADAAEYLKHKLGIGRVGKLRCKGIVETWRALPDIRGEMGDIAVLSQNLLEFLDSDFRGSE